MTVFGTDQEQQEVMLAYRRVARTEDGRTMFLDLLRICKTFDLAENDEDRTRRNLGQIILNRLGIMHDKSDKAFLSKILELPMPAVVEPPKEEESAG